MNTAGQIGSFLSSVAFGYMVESFGSYDRALLPLAFMLGPTPWVNWTVLDRGCPALPWIDVRLAQTRLSVSYTLDPMPWSPRDTSRCSVVSPAAPSDSPRC
jgi:hypothetical protein